MIVTALNTNSPPVAPMLSYPFLWRGTHSGRVYLRVASFYIAPQPREVDICLLSDNPRSYPIGALCQTTVDDSTAWGWRLPASEQVTLANG